MKLCKTANDYCVNEVFETRGLRFVFEVKASGQRTRVYHKPRYTIRAEWCSASSPGWLKESVGRILALSAGIAMSYLGGYIDS
jgi:hypothetical protein